MLFSIFIFSKSLNLFIVSIVSDSCTFCFELGFCLSLKAAEADGHIGDLLVLFYRESF